MLRLGGSLSGLVLDGLGEPAAGIPIMAQLGGGLEGQSTLSDSAGQFEFGELAPGRWQILAMVAPDLVLANALSESAELGSLLASLSMATVSLADGEHQDIVLGRPPEDPVRVSGRVVTDGAPVAATLTFLPEGVDDLAAVKLTQSGEDGSYEIDLDGAGNYLVSVEEFEGISGRTKSTSLHNSVPSGVEQ